MTKDEFHHLLDNSVYEKTNGKIKKITSRIDKSNFSEFKFSIYNLKVQYKSTSQKKYFTSSNKLESISRNYLNSSRTLTSNEFITTKDEVILKNSLRVKACQLCSGKGMSLCKECNNRKKIICEICKGQGNTNCRFCFGKGEILCSVCGGTGQLHFAYGKYKPCSNCYGSRYTRCLNFSCSNGKTECIKCNGYGNYDCNLCYGKTTTICNDCNGSGEIVTFDVSEEIYFLESKIAKYLPDTIKEKYPEYNFTPRKNIKYNVRNQLLLESSNSNSQKDELSEFQRNVFQNLTNKLDDKTKRKNIKAVHWSFTLTSYTLYEVSSMLGGTIPFKVLVNPYEKAIEYSDLSIKIIENPAIVSMLDMYEAYTKNLKNKNK